MLLMPDRKQRAAVDLLVGRLIFMVYQLIILFDNDINIGSILIGRLIF